MEDEVRLLRWAVESIRRAKNLPGFPLASYSCVTSKGLESWEDVSRLLPGRSGLQCRCRWISDRARQSRKLPWSAPEDELLRQLMQERREKPRTWDETARALTERSQGIPRTGKQCRERWMNHLREEIKKYT